MGLELELNNECKIKKVYSDNDTKNLFSKYNIRYVPSGLLLSKDRYIPIEGKLNNENIRKHIKKIKN